MKSLDWMDHAACVGMGKLFFPAGNPWSAGYKAQTARAARVCAGCPVRWQCRTTAKANDEHFGVWGGCDFGAGWNPSGHRRRVGAGDGRRVRPRSIEIELEEKAGA